MSLFKAREFWATQCGSNEEYDQLSIHVANIDNSPDNSDKIIVGSHSGMLRIYGLKNSKLSSNQIDIDELGFNENNVMMEMSFPNPILQVQSGILLSASDKRQLLILFPRKFIVYSVTSNEGLSEYGFSYSVTQLYEHELQRSAFNLVIGPFGQTKGRDFVCVQSLDCCLMFFEQEIASFWLKTVSNNSLLPTSFAYLLTTDTFLIQSADWTLQCFRYQMLAISAHQDEKNSKNLRKVVPDWTFELGESILQIQTVCLESSSLIVVLGEKNLFILRSNGTMCWQKKFDFKPICCHSYFTLNSKGQTNTDSNDNNKNLINKKSDTVKHTIGNDQKQQSLLEDNLVILLITEMSTLHIYKRQKLIWACQIPILYCQVLRSNYYFSSDCELTGCLTFLSSTGDLSVNFLGTNPSLDIVNNVKSNLMNRRSTSQSSTQNKKTNQTRALSAEDKEQLFTNTQMDKEEFDKELNELRKIINAYNSDFSSLIKLNNQNQDGNQSNIDDLKVEIIDFKCDLTNDNFNKQIKFNKNQANIIDLEFNLECDKQLSNLIISLNAANYYNITPNQHNFIKLESFKDNNFQFRLFYDSLNKLLSFRSNQIYLIINYFNEKNLPRIFTKLIELPISLFCKLQNKNIFNQNSRASSSTNNSQSSSASRKSLKQTTNQSIDQSSLDQYLIENNQMQQTTNTISFQFYTKKSINLNSFLHEMINQNNLNKLFKKQDDDISFLNNNKITIQFLSNKMKLVHCEFILINDDNDTNNERSYRCQIVSDDLHSNCFVFNLIITKLYKFYLDKLIDKILINRTSIPINEYFELINQHLNIRKEINLKKQLLEEHCERLRVIEKRILIKLKDRNISNLNNLETLLNVQHQKIISFANEIIQLENDLDDESIKLNCINQLICSMLKCVNYLNDEEIQLLESSFNILPFVQKNDLEEWQEKTELSLNFILKNHLKDNVSIIKTSNNELTQPDDCENLFKLIKLTIEKIFQGSLFYNRSIGHHHNLNRQPIIEVDEENDKT